MDLSLESFFDQGTNVLGTVNSPYFAVSRTGNAYLTPLIAKGKYRVYGAIDPDLIIPFVILRSNPPLITLVEYDVLFDFSPIIPGWQFTPFNYTGNFAIKNGAPVPVRQTDNLAFGIYNVTATNIFTRRSVSYDFNMRTPFPNHTEPVGLGISTERGEYCSPLFGSGTSVMRVDAFAAVPNAAGTFTTSTLAVWQFFKNASTSATPWLYNFVPKTYPGRAEPSCLATL